MKKIIIALLAVVTMSQAEMFTNVKYDCLFGAKVEEVKRFFVVEGGEIARIDAVMLFKLKGTIMYSGVTSGGTKLIVYPDAKNDAIYLSLEGSKDLQNAKLSCVEVAKK